jgi:hypothetical protein
LLDDPDLRVAMGLNARERVVRELDWRPQSHKYVSVFDQLSGDQLLRGDASAAKAIVEAGPGVDQSGHEYVDVSDR